MLARALRILPFASVFILCAVVMFWAPLPQLWKRELIEWAVLLMQRHTRGFLARNRLKALKEARRQHKAALTIQSAAQDWKARLPLGTLF